MFMRKWLTRAIFALKRALYEPCYNTIVFFLVTLELTRAIFDIKTLFYNDIIMI